MTNHLIPMVTADAFTQRAVVQLFEHLSNSTIVCIAIFVSGMFVVFFSAIVEKEFHKSEDPFGDYRTFQDKQNGYLLYGALAVFIVFWITSNADMFIS